MKSPDLSTVANQLPIDSGIMAGTREPQEISGDSFQEILCPGVKIKRVRTDADLSGASFEWAIERYVKEFAETPDILVVNPNELGSALVIVKHSGLEFRVITIPLILIDSWCLCGEKGIVWSPGA